MKMTNKVYDALKWVALVALDAVGLFYQTLSAIWNLPYGDQVLSTCVAISVCLGTLLQISSSKYKGDK